MALTKEEEARALKLLEKAKKQAEYSAKYVREKYDRVGVTLPKGTKDRLKAVGINSLNGFINELIFAELERLEAEQGITQDSKPDDTDNVEVPF